MLRHSRFRLCLLYTSQLTNKKFAFYENDVCDEEAVRRIFTDHKIDAVIHFAGYKAVGESVATVSYTHLDVYKRQV